MCFVRLTDDEGMSRSHLVSIQALYMFTERLSETGQQGVLTRVLRVAGSGTIVFLLVGNVVAGA